MDQRSHKGSYKGRTERKDKKNQFLSWNFKNIHDNGASSFFLNKKGSFVLKCVICDEIHEEHLHQEEFALEELEESEETAKKTEEDGESVNNVVHQKIKPSVQVKEEEYTTGKEANNACLS